MISKQLGIESVTECPDEVPEAVATLRRILDEYDANARNRLHALRRSAIVSMMTGPSEPSDEKTARRSISR